MMVANARDNRNTLVPAPGVFLREKSYDMRDYLDPASNDSTSNMTGGGNGIRGPFFVMWVTTL